MVLQGTKKNLVPLKVPPKTFLGFFKGSSNVKDHFEGFNPRGLQIMDKKKFRLENHLLR